MTPDEDVIGPVSVADPCHPVGIVPFGRDIGETVMEGLVRYRAIVRRPLHHGRSVQVPDAGSRGLLRYTEGEVPDSCRNVDAGVTVGINCENQARQVEIGRYWKGGLGLPVPVPELTTWGGRKLPERRADRVGLARPPTVQACDLSPRHRHGAVPCRWLGIRQSESNAKRVLLRLGQDLSTAKGNSDGGNQVA